MASLHRTSWIPGKVYPPSDDSFSLIDAFTLRLQSRPPPFFVLEVGSGSGFVATSVALQTRSVVVATDVTESAGECTRKTAVSHQVEGRVLAVLASFWNGIVIDRFDLILFNPPYVPTPVDEMEGDGLSVSWAGGVGGRQVIDEFLARVFDVMTTRDVEVLLVTISQNRPFEIIEDTKKKGFFAEVILKRKADEELLFVLSIRRIL